MDILSVLKNLNACHGPSGDEGGVAELIKNMAAAYADEHWFDAMGNLIVHKRGNGAKVMFAAHMDSIGMIVTHIEEDGFLRFGKVGGLNLTALVHASVRFANGTRGLVGFDQSADVKKLSVEDMFIDIGAHSREEAEKLVRIGDTAVFDAESIAAGGRIVSPYLDNRISCVILLAAMEKLKSSDNDLYFVFTTQEEVGLRGAKTAAYAIDPDYALAIDVTLSDDLPGAKHNGSSVLGKGAAIKVMDSSVISHPQVVSILTELAKENGIAYQNDVIRAGGTDAGAIHVSRAGVYTGGISIPCRYIHTPTEMVQISDVEACIDLTAAFACAKLETGV
ncbi:MAG: M42 family metallopeptidase [Butyricicoccus sp.]|nr:M42 family metallopeptidase [Butyricicoccus sp.]